MFKFVQSHKLLTISPLIDKLEEREIARCRQLIEEKLNWSTSEHWSTRDFERLSEQISQQTGVYLSITTLKRVWGRVKYDSSPTATTLDTLVAFIGYANWQAFKNRSVPEPPARAPLPLPARPVAKIPYFLLNFLMNHGWLRAVFGLWLFGMLTLFFSDQSTPPSASHRYLFSSRTVTNGIPNSVVFHYDATASLVDSVFIQQSWDPRRRQHVPKNGHEHTSIYYLPGYYRAKLVVGRRTVREHDLLIPSDG